MGEAANIAHLISGFQCQLELHKLETEFVAGSQPSANVRRRLTKLWPHARKVFDWSIGASGTDVRAAILLDKMAGVAGRLLEATFGRHILIQWREAAVDGTTRAMARGSLPTSSEFDMVHDLLGHLTYLGYLHFANNNFERARTVLQQALIVGEENDRHFADATALLHLAFVSISEENLAEAEDLLQRALALPADNETPSLTASIHIALGVVCGRRNDYARAREHDDAAVAAYEGLQDAAGLCTALINRGGDSINLGMIAEARADLERADAIAKALNAPYLTGLAKANLARLRAGEHPEEGSEVVELLKASKADYSRAGDRVQTLRIGGMLAGIYQSVLDREAEPASYQERKLALAELGDLAAERADGAAALQCAEQLLRETEERNATDDLPEALMLVAHRHVLLQHYPEATTYALRALSELDTLDPGTPDDDLATIRCELLSDLAQSERHLGQADQAEAHFRAALALAADLPDEGLQWRLRGNLGLALVDLGRFDDAIPILRDLVDDLRATEEYDLIGQAQFNLAHALNTSGDRDAARTEAEAALALLDMIHDPKAAEIRRQVADWPGQTDLPAVEVLSLALPDKLPSGEDHNSSNVSHTTTPGVELLGPESAKAAHQSSVTPLYPQPDPQTSSPDGKDSLACAIDNAKARGKAFVDKLFDDPAMLNAVTTAERLNTNLRIIKAMRHDGRLLGLEGSDGQVRYPLWQFGPDGQPLRLLPKLLSKLGDSWAVYRFLLQVHPELGGTTGLAVAREPGLEAELLALADSLSYTTGG